ncbi:MAG: acyltransferase [Planctomycetota bacterium]
MTSKMKTNLFYTREELLDFGFSSVGENVQVSTRASVYAISGTIGSNVRVDDFCILKGHVEIGSYVHICAYCSVSGVRGAVRLGDFSTLANRVSIYTGSDDYSASALSSSVVPQDTVVTMTGDVTLEHAALVGAHTVILPGVTIGEGASVGAMCVINKNVAPAEVLVRMPPGVVRRGLRDLGSIRALAGRVREREQHGSEPMEVQWVSPLLEPWDA